MNDHDELQNLEIAIEFHPQDAAAAEIVKQTFAGEEILESSAFTGAEIVTVIVSAAQGTLGSLLLFFAGNRDRFKNAVVKITPGELSLSGYSMEEIQAFIASDAVKELMKEMRKK